MATLTVELVSPSRIVWSGDAEIVLARSVDGEVGILARHAPLLAALDYGVVRIRPSDGGEEIVAAVDGGFLSVSPTTDDGVTKVAVLAETALLADDIDVAAARAELDAAQALDTVTNPDARQQVKAAQARLTAAGVA
jgi:F-type H+-transporting ATPase subunit epsilon